MNSVLQGLTYWIRKPSGVAGSAEDAASSDSGSDVDSDDGKGYRLGNIHRRGDSVSSFRRSDDQEASVPASARPIFFIHGVGFGLVRSTKHDSCTGTHILLCSWGLSTKNPLLMLAMGHIHICTEM
jgi:hypothetical protein